MQRPQCCSNVWAHKRQADRQAVTLTVFLAYFSRAAPWVLKMATLALRRSFLSMPSFLGMEPTKMAASRSLKPTSTLSVGMTSVGKGGVRKKGKTCQIFDI